MTSWHPEWLFFHLGLSLLYLATWHSCQSWLAFLSRVSQTWAGAANWYSSIIQTQIYFQKDLKIGETKNETMSFNAIISAEKGPFSFPNNWFFAFGTLTALFSSVGNVRTDRQTFFSLEMSAKWSGNRVTQEWMCLSTPTFSSLPQFFDTDFFCQFL